MKNKPELTKAEIQYGLSCGDSDLVSITKRYLRDRNGQRRATLEMIGAASITVLSLIALAIIQFLDVVI